MSPAILRPATADDVDALLALRVLMFEAMGTPAAALAEPRWQAADRIDLAATPEGEPLYRSLGFDVSAFPTVRRLAPVPER